MFLDTFFFTCHDFRRQQVRTYCLSSTSHFMLYITHDRLCNLNCIIYKNITHPFPSTIAYMSENAAIETKLFSKILIAMTLSVVWWVKYNTQVDTMMPYMMTSSPAGEPSTSPEFPRGFMGEFQGIIPAEISSWFPCGNEGEMKGNFLCGYFRLLSLWNPWGYFRVEISLMLPSKISKYNLMT